MGVGVNGAKEGYYYLAEGLSMGWTRNDIGSPDPGWGQTFKALSV